MDRRQGFRLLTGATAFFATMSWGGAPTAVAQTQPESVSAPPTGPFTLPPLGYPDGALEPYIDATTMMIHHDRHHAAYVNACDQLVERWPELGTTPMEQLLADLSKVPDAFREPVRNNLGGHWNHTYFWELMTPGWSKHPAGDLESAIKGAFGDVETMSGKVNAAGLGRFGSGWVWLVLNKGKRLDIVSTANQDTPLELGVTPVLGVDVWEHAYYLKYQNRRADYLRAWWDTVNWDKALANFKKAAG